MKHILLKTIVPFSTKTENVPNVYRYKPSKGYWVNTETNTPMMKDDEVKKPRTKKADIETGEDKKGE